MNSKPRYNTRPLRRFSLKRPFFLVTIMAVGMAVFASGCAQLNVRHLKRQPWQTNEKQNLQLEFWNFSYEPLLLQDSYDIRGRAYPVMDGLPQWATYIDELWFAVYLSDSLGRVLAKDVQVMPPRELSRQEISDGIPFEFTLRPDDIGGKGKLFVTFGYRMVLTDNGAPDKKQHGEPRVFFANEGALSHL